MSHNLTGAAHLTAFPPERPDYYCQYRQEDAVKKSIYDLNFSPDPLRSGKSRAVLVIDSRDRKSGTPSDYTYEFGDVLYDVVSVELKLIEFPFSSYLINSTNNQFYFQDTAQMVREGTFIRLTLPPGNYLPDNSDPAVDTIRSLLERGLNAASSSQYRVTVNPNQNRFTIAQISGSGVFNILFQAPQRLKPDQDGQNCPEERYLPQGALIEHTMEDLLGFTPRNRYDRTSYTSDRVYDLFTDQCLVLHIESDGRPWRRVIAANDAYRNAFAIFPFERNLNNFQYRANIDDVHSEVYNFDFKEPVKMGRIRVRITNNKGQLIDFNGLNHIMIFEICSLSRFTIPT